MNGKFKPSLTGWLKRSNGGAISLLRMKILMMIILHMFQRETLMKRECKVKETTNIYITQEQKVNTNKITTISCKDKTNI